MGKWKGTFQVVSSIMKQRQLDAGIRAMLTDAYIQGYSNGRKSFAKEQSTIAKFILKRDGQDDNHSTDDICDNARQLSENILAEVKR